MKNVKLLFIQPRLTFSNLINSPNIGIAYLAAVLQKENFEVQILDFTSKKMSNYQFKRFLKEKQFDIVAAGGQSAIAHKSLEYFSIAKGINPDILTVAGGPHFSFTDTETLDRYPGLDVIIRGEAEDSMLELCKSFSSGKQYTNIKGITYRDSKNEIIRNEPRALIGDLDSLPYPAWNLLPIDAYHRFGTPMLGIISSRGCVFQCDHCITWKNYNSQFRNRKPEKIMDEMVYVKERYGINTFFFHDDQSFSDKKQMQGFLNALANVKDKLYWCIPTQMDVLLSYKELWKDMKQLGLFEIDIGLEAYEEEQVKYYKKKVFSKKEIMDFLYEFDQKLDILISTYFVIGAENESEASIINTIKFQDEITDLYVTRGISAILTPFPGTVLFEKYKNENKLLTTDWKKYDLRHTVFKTKVHPKRIEKFQQLAFMGMGSPAFYKRLQQNKKSENPFRRKAARCFERLTTISYRMGMWKKLRKLYK